MLIVISVCYLSMAAIKFFRKYVFSFFFHLWMRITFNSSLGIIFEQIIILYAIIAIWALSLKIFKTHCFYACECTKRKLFFSLMPTKMHSFFIWMKKLFCAVLIFHENLTWKQDVKDTKSANHLYASHGHIRTQIDVIQKHTEFQYTKVNGVMCMRFHALAICHTQDMPWIMHVLMENQNHQYWMNEDNQSTKSRREEKSQTLLLCY